MSELQSASSAAKAAWQTAAQARASEEAQLNLGLGLLDSFAYFTSRVDAWRVAADRWSVLSKRKRDGTKDEAQIIQRLLWQFKRCLDQHGNGFTWICTNTSFPSIAPQLDLAFAQLDRFASRDSQTAAALIKDQFSDDLEVIQKAADVARTYSESAKEVAEALDNVRTWSKDIESTRADSMERSAQLAVDFARATDESATKLQESQTRCATSISELASKIEAGEDELKAIEDSLTERESNTKKLNDDIVGFHARAQKTVAAAVADRDAAKLEFQTAMGVLTETSSKLELSKQALSEALRNVRRQGLSGAFFEKAIEVRKQRQDEERNFILALVYLSAVGVLGLGIEYVHGLPTDFTQWLLRSARTFVLAAPGVWIAWMSARRLGALNRMVSDYEYKSAAALAFESYRQEIETSGSKGLMDELLANAIITFGENPTRYYDHAKDEAAIPTESLLARLKSRPQPRGGAASAAATPVESTT